MAAAMRRMPWSVRRMATSGASQNLAAACTTVSSTGRSSVGGPRDGAEDLRGGRLLFQRVGEVTIALLKLGEQAHVLDGDHRLIRERLEQSDLLIGERRDFGAPELDDANGHALSEEGHAEEGAVAELPGKPHRQRELAIVGLRIRDLDGPCLDNRATADRPPVHGKTQLRRGGNR